MYIEAGPLLLHLGSSDDYVNMPALTFLENDKKHVDKLSGASANQPSSSRARLSQIIQLDKKHVISMQIQELAKQRSGKLAHARTST